MYIDRNGRRKCKKNWESFVLKGMNESCLKY